MHCVLYAVLALSACALPDLLLLAHPLDNIPHCVVCRGCICYASQFEPRVECSTDSQCMVPLVLMAIM